MRRRFMKQVEDTKLFGIQGFCKDLLEVNFIIQGYSIMLLIAHQMTLSYPVHIFNIPLYVYIYIFIV